MQNENAGQKMVLGLFADRSTAENAILELLRAGIAEESIGFEMRHGQPGAMSDEPRWPAALRATGLGTRFTGETPEANSARLQAYALLQQRLPEQTRNYLQSNVQAGAAAVFIEAGSQTQQVEDILRRHGAQLQN
ncbi:MAG: hypothetical protein KME03_03000 [Aphanocapsa lilacina HA4352-LM1]|jgi:hypothetical protein|nr:hypothetical protein [Aphanocapsa lilacina HA4352-LM1]